MTAIRTGKFRFDGKMIFLFVLCLPFFPDSSFAQTQTWKWTTELVGTNGVQNSIAVDNDLNVHISYFSAGVKYAFRPANSSKWFTMELAPGSGYAEVATRVALDSSGNPHICFTPGVLKYASFEKREWNIQQIDPQSGLIEYTCSLAIAADGTPHVSWYQYGGPLGGYFLHLKYAVLKKDAWLARTVDFEGQTGKWNCLVLDEKGNPHITYDSFLKGEIKYAYWDGKDWHRTVVDSPDISPNSASGGMGNSILLNRDGKAQISYVNGEAVKYAWEKNDTFKLDTVDHVTLTGSWSGYRSRQALDLEGNPHLVYEDGGAVKHAYWDGNNWTIQVISPAGTHAHRYEDIAIDRRGTIYVVYTDGIDGSVKIAIGTPQPQAQSAAATEKK
ncbi:MAG TPA: hypothetical protein VGI46_16160 [Candidatus Acidoferrum sp.]|jgi:hypothetical protein